MDRPLSIRKFEVCYLGALVVGAVNTTLNWSRYYLNPAVGQAEAIIGVWYLPTITALGYLIPLTLWYFAARRGSVVAKWIIVVLFALGALGVLAGLALNGFPSSLAAVLSISAFVLNAIAIRMLFQPDAAAWFGQADADADEMLAVDHEPLA